MMERKRVSVLRHISLLLLSVSLMLMFGGSIAVGAPANEGRGKDAPEFEERTTGEPVENADAWGAVTSRTTSSLKGPEFGQHASNPTAGDDQPRKGIGNVALSDEKQAADLLAAGFGGTNPTGEGTHVSTHGCVVDEAFGTDCEAHPGNPEKVD